MRGFTPIKRFILLPRLWSTYVIETRRVLLALVLSVTTNAVVEIFRLSIV